MPTLTRNLFRGSGETDHALEVKEGRWPTDADGWVFIVGPDKRAPSGHWFVEHGLLCRIAMTPDANGRIEVRHRLVDNPIAKLRARLPSAFRRALVLEVSPFGFSNLANTNVQAFEGRLFLGYDVGRPIEVDPHTLSYRTAIGANDEWEAVLPGLVDPLVQIAAHPAPSLDERALYFVNYVQIPVPGAVRGTYVARFAADGSFVRKKLAGPMRYDSIHDVKASRRHLVISDLPFVIEPGSFQGKPRTRAAQDFTQLFIVRKDDFERTTPGGEVPVVTAKLAHGTGHLIVDEDDDGDRLTVYLQHIPASDLLLTCGPAELGHGNGAPIPKDYEGLPFLGMQPGLVGKYVIDARTGDVLEKTLAFDERFWGGVLFTQNLALASSRARASNLYYGAMGFDPDLVPESGYRLYRDYAHAIVPTDRLPTEYVPGALARFDLATMRVADLYRYEGGAFPHPPTFVPRRGGKDDRDGYVVVVVHRDGDKLVEIFDARDLARGPIARATAPGFSPPLLLHSCHLDPSDARERPDYRVSGFRDAISVARHFGPERWRALAEWTRRIVRAKRAA